MLLNGEPGNVIRHKRGLRQGDPLSPLLFIIAMDVLTNLFSRAEGRGLLQPLAPSAVWHRISIYADDVVLFTSPNTEDLSLIKAILHKFGEASGLQANMAKSSIIPIRCNDGHEQEAQQVMECQVGAFPCKYLGLPLTLGRLTKVDLQPILDKIAD